MTTSTSATTTNSNPTADALLDALSLFIKPLGKTAIALSGGVDSSLVAAVARTTLGRNNVLAITGVSKSLSSYELETIRDFCRERDIALTEVPTRELENPDYIKNSPDRCYFCKAELYGRLTDVAQESGITTILDGTHAEDLAGHRPGKRAADERGVRSPLLELGLGKDAVRTMAHALNLQNAARPSAPCLSSRVAYGVAVTPERLSRVERAEAYMAELGFDRCRVRLHDHIARIEVPQQDLPGVVELSSAIESRFREIGFTYVTLDLRGLRSGSLLEVLPDATATS